MRYNSSLIVLQLIDNKSKADLIVMMALRSTLQRDLVSLNQNVKLTSMIQIWIAMTCLYKQTACTLEETLIEVSVNNDCIHPCDTVTYECTIVGSPGGLTVWAGDFFIHCLNDKRVMELRHSPAQVGEISEFTNRTCNNGSIVGRIVRVENGSYTSQLNVTLTSDIVGRSIECSYDNGTIHRIGSLNLTRVLAPGLNSLPGSISSATTLSQFYTIRTFTWNTPFSGCPNVHYNILASNCGSCPTTTNHTNITCTDVPTDGSTCTFTLQTVVCGIITGELNRVSLPNSITPGSSENGSALISAVSLGVALLVCLIGLIVVIILLIRYKIKLEKVVLNTTADKVQSRESSVTQSSRINTKKNISYVVHTPRTESAVTMQLQ